MRKQRLISRLTGVCAATAIVLWGHSAAAALPGKATLISPSGNAGTNTPTYSWNADPNSTWYYLWVDDSTGNRITQWYTAAQAACQGGGICSVTSSFALAQGSARWWIQTWSPSGDGPWSDGMAFTVPSPVPPGKATLISPSATVGKNSPTYSWNADPNSTWYYLWVDDSTGTRITQWYQGIELGCIVGGVCSVTPDIALVPGLAEWWIQTWSSIGDGPWSDGMFFTVPSPVPPGKATLISPSGTIGTNTPNYIWNADPNSTWYCLWVDDSVGNRVNQWYREDEVGCLVGTVCYVKPDIALAQGEAKWWIQTWNGSGGGLWSDGMAFTVPVPAPPGKVTLNSPSGTIGTNTPGYTWNADPKSTWYYLLVKDSTGARIQKWYKAAQTGCPDGAGTCVAWPGVYLLQGPGEWWVQAWSPNGYGTESDGMVFTVPTPVPGSMADLGTLGGWSVEAAGVSADGNVIVGRALNNYGNQHAFRWTPGAGMADLGTLGGPESEANGVSTDGNAVVGFSKNNAGVERAFRWTQGDGMADLGTLGGSWSKAKDVSMDGSVVVGDSTNAVGKQRAFRWTQAGGMVDLGTLGGSESKAKDVSMDGSVVVGDSTNGVGKQRAFRWTQAGGMVNLGTLGGSESKAIGVSTDGSVVAGSSYNSSGNQHAFRWTQAGGMVDLGTLGGSWSEASMVSADGAVIVGGSTNSGQNNHAFRWTQGGGMIDLGTLGGSESKASGVSADGSVVAGYSWCNTTIYHAFSWTQGNGMVDLGTVGGGSYSNANGVSADGSAVVGYSDTSFGHWHAFRWK